MRVSLGCTLFATAVAVYALDDTIGASIDAQGVTQLYGNSFGRPGYNETYDYVVVGGGNAGSVIAARLALGGYSVAVVEAGSFYEITDGNRTQVPGYNYVDTSTQPTGYTPLPNRWSLFTVPQPGYNNREVFYGTGQTFGGSTATNFGGFNRATEGTFDDKWAKEVNDDFWTWANVYPAYKKSMHFAEPDFSKIDPTLNITFDPTAYDAEGGPVWLSFGNNQGLYGPSLEAAMEASGFDRLQDLDAGKLIGFGTAKATLDTRTATRSTAEAFLQMAAKGSDIKLYPNALATSIAFDANKKATGVNVMSNVATSTQLTYHLSVNKEVIVTAGVWRSPQLLMVSGIGPADTLQQHGIDVVADLPAVGQNQWDQPSMPMLFQVSVETHTQFIAGIPEVVAEQVGLYLNNQSGMLSGIGAGQAVGKRPRHHHPESHLLTPAAFDKFSLSKRANFSASTQAWLDSFPSDWPDVQIIPMESATYPGAPDDAFFMLVSASILSPKSKGNMTISSASMLDSPVISPNWLEDDADVEMAYATFQRLREIGSNWNSSVNLGEAFPGATLSGKANITEWLRNNMIQMSHGTSSCKMGTDNQTSVVDSRGRVYGVTGLRVGDSSAFPFCPPGLPMSGAYMFGEKIAETILEGN
ncbi:versicolorin B synthase [Coleophoma cylindrospora]|uniref:Versicolorin B synthase n=1 Tax=Coleophoma cylindrospora TaxID=1849047 RepID=A0A3D8S217_9HELO|nr:versicolorin B synthase [Coleophoma cylindrospora]